MGVNVVRERLNVFVRATQPLVQYYRGRSVHREVDGTKTPDEVSAELARAVAEERR